MAKKVKRGSFLEKHLVMTSLVQALAVYLYVWLVINLMQVIPMWLMPEVPQQVAPGDILWMPVIYLMLFVISAAITASLVFGKGVLMYLDGLKKSAVKLVLMTIGWMVVLVGLTVLLLAMG